MAQFSRFNEEDHPRDNDGKFTSKGGGSSAGKGETPHSGQAGNKDYGKDMLAKNKVFDKAPDGWKPIEGATTAPKGYKWYSNGKSMFGGDYEQALVKVGETKEIQKVPEEKMKQTYEKYYNIGKDEFVKKYGREPKDEEIAAIKLMADITAGIELAATYDDKQAPTQGGRFF